MTLISRVWNAVVDLTVWLSATEAVYGPSQRIISPDTTPAITPDVPQISTSMDYGHTPEFKPPSGDLDSTFTCKYPHLTGWTDCSTPENRGCWLRHENGTEYNITTNYEYLFPEGKIRKYELIINEENIDADGMDFLEGKTFNHKFPGPWIQACWGDELHITVTNNMKKEGTSIHWHGIRQLHSLHMDGVNGITQCPIPPGSSFTYKFKAMQYGTSWYHSHYSVQYADGLQGPITIHGPSSDEWDENLEPLLMTDWAHTSALSQLLYKGNDDPSNKTILLNGVGDVRHFGYPAKKDFKPVLYSLNVTAEPVNGTDNRRKYLLRLINTSFDTTFIFSIDNHWLQVISADFVPIVPYRTNRVLVGIGQRYNVIVEAQPDMGLDRFGEPIPAPDNFWMRTYVANHCGNPPQERLGYSYAKTGVLRYNKNNDEWPQTDRWIFDLKCADEKFENLVPILPWTVGEPANTNFDVNAGQRFDVGFAPGAKNAKVFKKIYPDFPVALFSLQHHNVSLFSPLQVTYDDPTIGHLNEPVENYPQKWVVVPEDVKEDQWVYLALTTDNSSLKIAHPIHLHGHDFAILQQEEFMEFNITNFKPKKDNPPRRDVVHLPQHGFVVIAFKADNPGTWLMHCHIATHASMGLALQILERQGDAAELYGPRSDAMADVDRICKDWTHWTDTQIAEPHLFEGDSGI